MLFTKCVNGADSILGAYARNLSSSWVRFSEGKIAPLNFEEIWVGTPYSSNAVSSGSWNRF